VFANGNLLFQEDIEECLKATGCDGVSSAEGVLYNPALYHTPASSTSPLSNESILALHPRNTLLASQYLQYVLGQKTKTTLSAVKGHLFKLLRPALTREKDLRDRLGRVIMKGNSNSEKGKEAWLQECVNIVEDLRVRMEVSARLSFVDWLLMVVSARRSRCDEEWLNTPCGPHHPRRKNRSSLATPLAGPTVLQGPATTPTARDEEEKGRSVGGRDGGGVQDDQGDGGGHRAKS